MFESIYFPEGRTLRKRVTVGNAMMSSTLQSQPEDDARALWSSKKRVPPPYATIEERAGAWGTLDSVSSKYNVAPYHPPPLPSPPTQVCEALCKPPAWEVMSRSGTVVGARDEGKRSLPAGRVAEIAAALSVATPACPQYAPPLRRAGPTVTALPQINTFGRTSLLESALALSQASVSTAAVTAKLQRRGSGLRGLTAIIRLLGKTNDSSISTDEFLRIAEAYGIWLSFEEVSSVFAACGSQSGNSIKVADFLRVFRGFLSPKRLLLVEKAFSLLDKDGTGEVPLDSLLAAFDPRGHPDVIAGVATAEQIHRDYVDLWDEDLHSKITAEMFMECYRDISCSIEHDDYFELMLRNTFHISGGNGVSANTTCLRVLVTHTDGRQTVQEIKDDLFISSHDANALLANLAAQGINDVVCVQSSF